VGAILLLLAVSSPRLAPSPAAAPAGLEKIEHVIVIYAENRSFDHLYGLFPGANGLSRATPEQMTQLDHDGRPFTALPPVWRPGGHEQDSRFPADLPNRPFRLDAPPIGLALTVQFRSPVHRFYQNAEQIAGGKNNRFAAVSDVGGLVMGYYDGSQLPLWPIAREFVLADNFFMGAFGGSFLNHLWLVCACTPRAAAPPAGGVAQVDEAGRLRRRSTSPASAMQGPPQFFDGDYTPDGYAVNTAQPPYQPSGTPPAAGGDPRFADPAKLVLPPLAMKTVGDTLSAKGVSWAWYAGEWRRALADGMQPPGERRSVIYTRKQGTINFQPHHHPFNYFARFAPGTVDRERHLKDYQDLVAEIDAGTLPAVAFYKPHGDLNEHPAYTDVRSGDQHIADLIGRIRQSRLWPQAAIVVTYDENGGWWEDRKSVV